MTKDMTTGSPMKLVLSFAIPLMFGNLFQQFYSMVDTIIVGQYLGVDALAAVGSVGSLQFLIIGFCTGSCAGLSIPVAQRFARRTRTTCAATWPTAPGSHWPCRSSSRS